MQYLNSIRLAHQNIQSLKNKIELIEVFLEAEKLDIVCISESWCDDTEMAYIAVSGYKMGSYFSRRLNKHGGVLILVKNSIKFVTVPEISRFCIELIFECACIQLTINNIKTCILCVYRSPLTPKLDFFDQLDQCLSYICNKFPFCRLIIVGDLNINFFQHSADRSKLLDILNSFGLEPAFSEPTRITANTSTAIDYICTNFNDILTCQCVAENGLSDHTFQLIEFPYENEAKNVSYRFRSFSKKNKQSFARFLNSETWTELNDLNNINDKFSAFIGILEYYYNVSFQFIEKKQTNFHNNNQWLTLGLKTSSRNLRKLHDEMRKGKITLEFYKKYKYIYRRLLRLAKRKYYDDKVSHSKNKTKTVWNLINSTVKNQANNKIDCIQVNDIEYTDPHDIANEFNSFFVNIPKKLQSKQSTSNTIIPDRALHIPFVDKSIYLYRVSEREVIETINSLSNSNSRGPDNFTSSIIKDCAGQLSKPLSMLMNTCFAESSFPDLLKLSKVICLYKKGDHKDVSNYRPISLLSVFSKIFEKILLKRIVHFLECNNLISNTQHGFRGKKSTLTALCAILDRIYKCLDNNDKVIALFVDLTKAFDCVDHELLLKKVQLYGIRGNCFHLLKSYLEYRKQYVLIEGEESARLSVNVGVPQGSVLGPLLFLMYTNDISNYLTTYHCEFADDITLLSYSANESEMNDCLAQNLNILDQYFCINKLTLNQNKTFTMQFHPYGANYTKSQLIKLNDKSVEQVTSFKLLGIHLDMSLNWNEHVNRLCKKCASNCFALCRLRQILSRNIIKIFYLSNFESIIRYGIILWGVSSAAQRVFIMQKRAVRCMIGLKFRESCKQTFINEAILTLPSIFILELLKFVRQNIASFRLQNMYHNYSTRFGSDFQYDLHRLELYKSNPYYLGAVFYNKIPIQIRELSNVKFVNYIKSVLINSAFYSVDEFLNYNFPERPL